MPVVGNDPVFEVVHVQQMHGQAVYNVYGYAITSGEIANNVPDLLAGWILNNLPEIKAVQHEDVLHIRLEARRLNDLTEFGVTDLTPQTGDITASEPLPIFNAGYIRLLRSTKETRSGAKRIVGLVESHVTDDSINATGQTAWDGLATELGSPFSSGGISFAPVILGGKTLDGVPVPEGSWIYNFVTEGQLVPEVTTQSSRKIGRGI